MTQKIKIATWNVNSIKARIESVSSWLKDVKPDIVLLQELKCLEENFPKEIIDDLGYNGAVFGQKTYNGVAILSKFAIEDVIKGIPGFEDEQSRYIEALIPVANTAIRVASIYVPNGGAELEPNQKVNETEKFAYKMNFYDHLFNHAKKLLAQNEITILGGDYNVCHNNIDAYDPISLKNSICFHDDERKKFRSLINLGYADSFRTLNPNQQSYSWWDYRGNSYKLGKGLRIDYLLTSPLAADKLDSCQMDESTMTPEKPSDHCPVICEIEL